MRAFPKCVEQEGTQQSKEAVALFIREATAVCFYKTAARKRQMQRELLIVQPCLTQTIV